MPYGIDPAMWRRLPADDQLAAKADYLGQKAPAIGGYAPDPYLNQIASSVSSGSTVDQAIAQANSKSVAPADKGAPPKSDSAKTSAPAATKPPVPQKIQAAVVVAVPIYAEIWDPREKRMYIVQIGEQIMISSATFKVKPA